MDLTSKLRRFLPQQDNSPAPVAKRVILEPFLQGQEVTTPFGPCYVVEKQLPLTDLHGHWPLRNVLEANYANPSVFAGGVGGKTFEIKNALFLDTETTGLSGGTGTYAFLVGLGFFTDTVFVVKQLLMRDYNEELALLYLIDEELRKRDIVVSFNGKSFDLPLLQTRFTISRLGFLGAHEKRHVDLLHLSRRFWKYKLDSCSLSSLEEHILGVKRSDDIPGYEIPGRYFEFLQTGDGSLLQNIVEHNLIDIVSMATLLYRLHVTGELDPEECDCSFEAEALANIHRIAQNPSLALRYLKAAEQLTDNDEQYLRVMRQAAFIFKRLGDYKRGAFLWQKILTVSPEDLSSAEELAKYYEHKAKDLDSAERVTRRALALAWQSRSPKIPVLEHRLKRLESKLLRQNLPI